MKHSIILLLAFLFATVQLQAQSAISFEPYMIKAESGDSLNSEIEKFEVPENRSKKDSRNIQLSSLRLQSLAKKPSSPIIYLAGGPGGSGIAASKGERFPLFDHFREISDVIALDQRGTGMSNSIPECSVLADIPIDEPGTISSYIDNMKGASEKCIAEWSQKGVDINGYTTRESVEDIEALRKRLKVDKITLWGISYGTHLALAYAKYYPENVDKLILASVERLDETIMLPHLTDEYLLRLNEYLKKDAAYEGYGDLQKLMQEVLDKLDEKPVTVKIPTRSGNEMTVGISKLDVQIATAAFFIKNPEDAIKLPFMYHRMKAGDFSQMAQVIAGVKQYGRVVQGMPLAMDCSSGISEQRWQQVQQEEGQAILGRMLSFPFPDVCSGLDIKDLGDEFRSSFKSEIPTLILSGDLDGRTYPESAVELSKKFSRSKHVIIKGAGHDLFMSSPEIETIMLNFLNNEKIEVDAIEVSVPSFIPAKP